MKKSRIVSGELAQRRKALLEKVFCPEGAILVAENEFEKKILNTQGAMVVKFWDGTPHPAQEAFSSVARKYSEEIKFACILVKDKQLRSKYNIRYSPTFVFFEDGEEKSRISGPTLPDALDIWCEVNRD